MRDPSPVPRTTPLSVGVVLFGGVEPLDAIGPAQVFWALEHIRPFVGPFPDVAVHLVAETAGPVEFGYGLRVDAAYSYDDCPPLDLLIVPGGSDGQDDDVTADSGRRFYEHDDAMHTFLTARAAEVEVLASVCTGAFLLGSAGLLDGRRAGTHWTARSELVDKMAARGVPFTLDSTRVVDDGDLVTAGGVSSGIDLALHLVGRFFGAELGAAAAMAIEIETPA